MAKLFKNSKSVLSIVLAFAVLAVTLFTGAITAYASTPNTIYYEKDTKTAPTSTAAGTADDPIIINTAEELAYIASGGPSVTQHNDGSGPKYFKMADSIDRIVLQKEKNAADIIALKDADMVEAYFTDSARATDLVYWQGAAAYTARATAIFCGHFDGNGVEIYGLFANPTDTYIGLFGQVDGNATIENVTVKNSYIKSNGNFEAAGIIGRTVNDVDSAYNNITLNNCAVANNYIYSTKANAGAIAGNSNGNNIYVNNCLVYGNEVYKGSKQINSAFGNRGQKTTTKISNSIILDSYPYELHCDWDAQVKVVNGANCYENVYTNMPAGTVIFAAAKNTEITYAENQIKSITDLSMFKGAAVKTNCSALDWKTIWIADDTDYPGLRSAHHITLKGDGHAKHAESCDVCGFGGVVEDCNYVDDDYICTICSSQCGHTNQTVNDTYAGDCVTIAGVFYKCNDCGREKVEGVGVAPGHQLEWKPERFADCEKEGRQGYWHCTVCGGNFTGEKSEATMAAMKTSIDSPETDPALVIPIAPHNATNREEGKILVVQDGNSGHYWICYTCDGKLLAVESEDYAPEGKNKKHNYEDGVCVDCAWECPEHDYRSSGVVMVAGSCTVDRVEEIKCTNCGDKKNIVIEASHKIMKVDEVAATDQLEGTKTHYACEACKEIYLDAEGKTKATEASLVIPKVLPKEYQNEVVGNVDTGSKSPATSDSLASAMAVVVLAGATLVFTRKVRG